MSRKLVLPRIASASLPPRVDEVRERLGGRAPDAIRAGRVVRVDATGTEGVALWSDGTITHVLSSSGVVRRVPEDALELVPAPSAALQALAADARVFAALAEGQAVRFDARGELRSGQLVEKCRYGGLVLTPDERVVGVGFRKLWPLDAGPPS